MYLIPSLVASLLYSVFYCPISTSDTQYPLQNGKTFNATHFDTTILSFVRAREIPALSVAVTYDDRLVYVAAFGWADLLNERLVDIDDRFRLASVSKSITAIAIMHLHQQGMLSLDDYVFGENGILGTAYGTKIYSDRVRNITVAHLLEHSSGFVNEDMCGPKCDPTYLDKFLDLDQWQLITALLDAYEPSHDPGTFASYSNFGYFIAGRVVEAASGVFPYERYVREEVLAKMEVSDMRIARNVSRVREVMYYDFKNPEGPYQLHIERRDSVGAWIATPIDLVQITTAIDGLPGREDFLNDTTRVLMFEQSPVNGSDFAKGWRIKLDTDGHLIEACKDGAYSGTNSILEIDFARNTSFAIVVNREVPRYEKFHGANDLKILMDELIGEVEEWPGWDLFD